MPEKRPDNHTPNITDEHRCFSGRVAAIAQDMHIHTLQTIEDRYGTPPSDYARQSLAQELCPVLTFGSYHNQIYRSRYLEGDIAGSDFHTVHQIVVPEEAWRGIPEETVAYPGRILEMKLHYGTVKSAVTHEFLLYALPTAPPVMVSEEGVQDFRPQRPSLSWLTTMAAGIYMEKLPARYIHYPSADELQLILGGLRAIYDDIDIAGVLSGCRAEAEADRDDNPAYEADRAWFVEQEHKARSAGPNSAL